VETYHDILEGNIEPVAQMEDPGNIGRRDDDHVGGITIPGTALPLPGLERPGFLPERVDSILKTLGIIGFFQFNRFHQDLSI
jgi:hypothetical protein